MQILSLKLDVYDIQDAGLKVKEYELIRRNFSESGNFGEQQWQQQRQQRRQ